MSVAHRAFGLEITSSRPLPLLDAVAHPRARAPLRLRFDAAPAPPDAHPVLDRDGLSVRRGGADGTLHLDFGAGLRFSVDARAGEVRAPRVRPGDGSIHYLLGPVLGCALRLRGVTLLHASALVLDGHAMLLLGPRGAGKSTIAATLARDGLATLTDDVAALRAIGTSLDCHPGYPGMRLWPESAAAVGLEPSALEELRPGAIKRYVDVRRVGWRRARRAAPLGALYVLDPSDASHPRVEPLPGRDALMALLAHAYAGEIPGLEPGPPDFDRLAALGDRLGVRRVSAGGDLGQLDSIARAVREDFAAIVAARARRTGS